MGGRWLEQPQHGRRDAPPHQAGEVGVLPIDCDPYLIPLPSDLGWCSRNIMSSRYFPCKRSSETHWLISLIFICVSAFMHIFACVQLRLFVFLHNVHVYILCLLVFLHICIYICASMFSKLISGVFPKQGRSPYWPLPVSHWEAGNHCDHSTEEDEISRRSS